MRVGFRATVSWVAIYAVALHVILLGFTPSIVNASATFDPFSVICHSVAHAGAPGNEAPRKADLVPGHACEHCNLCSAAAPPPAPDVALNVDFKPTHVLHVLFPASTPTRIGVTSDPKLARGPPQTA